jgi:hypothetical protein
LLKDALAGAESLAAAPSPSNTEEAL